MKWWFRQQLYTQIAICIGIGVALGLLLGPKALVLEPVGEIFIRLLKMLIVPLTFFTLVSGVTKMDGLRSLRSVGGMTVLYYAVTSVCAVTVGTVLALILQPGRGVEGLLESTEAADPQSFSFVDSIVSWIPTNPIEAAATGNMLQIIVFSLIVGLGLLAMGRRAERVVELFAVGADLMITITEFVMKLAPYGILALVATMTASLGLEMLGAVVRFVVTDYIALAVVLSLVYPLLLSTFGKVNPVRFYRNISPAMLVAASTTSSSATLPVSMGVAEKDLGVEESLRLQPVQRADHACADHPVRLPGARAVDWHGGHQGSGHRHFHGIVADARSAADNRADPGVDLAGGRHRAHHLQCLGRPVRDHDHRLSAEDDGHGGLQRRADTGGAVNGGGTPRYQPLRRT
jgi:Na+/H+-dicarboxylate symporter